MIVVLFQFMHFEQHNFRVRGKDEVTGDEHSMNPQDTPDPRGERQPGT
jgi:hypothetical protein